MGTPDVEAEVGKEGWQGFDMASVLIASGERGGPPSALSPVMTAGLGPRRWDSREPLFTELSSAQGSKCHMYKQEVVKHTENSGCLNSVGHHTSASHFPI